MSRNQIQRIGMGCIALMCWAGLSTGWAAGTASLKHAVVCPPFKGDSELAPLYHDEMVELLKSEDGVEYLEGVRALARRAPEYTYRVNGSIETNEEGESFVVISLMDNARKEQVASHIAPASEKKTDLKNWKKAMKTAIERRTSKQPFECRAVRRRRGQASLSLDRGLDSGLKPGMVLELAREEEKLISPDTGEVVGRDSPRAVGQIKVFRVMASTAYARPVEGTKIPSTKTLCARSF
jgi:hypothetical protein